MSQEDEIIINENFQELFNKKPVYSKHNATQDLRTKDDRLQAYDDKAELLR